jgi:hypothetical protein
LQYHSQYASVQIFATHKADHLKQNVDVAQALFHVRASHVYEFIAERATFDDIFMILNDDFAQILFVMSRDNRETIVNVNIQQCFL